MNVKVAYVYATLAICYICLPLKMANAMLCNVFRKELVSVNK